jgi:hypothetical protein
MSNADVSLPEDLENEKEYATKEEKKLATDFLRLLDDNSRFSSSGTWEGIKGIERAQASFSAEGLSIFGYSKKEKQIGVLVSDFGKKAIWYPRLRDPKNVEIDASFYCGKINSTFYFDRARASEGWYSEGSIFEGKTDDEGKIRLDTISGESGIKLHQQLRQGTKDVTYFYPPGTEYGSAKHSAVTELTLKSGETIRLLSGVFFKGNTNESIVRLYVLNENDKLLYSLPLALPPIQNTYFFHTEDGVIGRNIQLHSESQSESVRERYFSLKKLKLNEKKILHAALLSPKHKGRYLLVRTRGTEGDVFYISDVH